MHMVDSLHCTAAETNKTMESNYAAAAAKSLQSRPTLLDSIDGRPPGSSVPGILQARMLQWVAISFSNACMHAKSLQLCPTLCNHMDSSPPGSSVHRILQTRILEWVAKNEATVSANHVNLAVISLQSKRSGDNEGSFIVPLKNTGESALPRGH